MMLRWGGRSRQGAAVAWTFAAGALFGATLALLLDARRGAARRARLGQKAGAWARRARVQAERRVRDAAQRMAGRRHELRHAGEIVPDEILVERVRAHIGRPVKHARSIRVEAHGGLVVLAGPILRSEVQALVEAVGKVRGVKRVENRLEIRDQPGSLPGLQR